MLLALDEKVLPDDINIGAQLPLGSAFKMFQLPFTGFPELVGGSVQDIGEYRDQNGAKRDDVVVAGIVPKRSDKADCTFMHGGAGVFAGIVLYICLLA